MIRTVIFRQVRDPETGKLRLMGFPYAIKNPNALPQVLKDIDRRLAEREHPHG